MSVKTRITEKKPRTGALPSEQAAAQLKELHSENGGQSLALQQDKLIWQLVMNCVDYAAEQFEGNLQFNSNTLTNVLYDNIYKLLGNKLNEEEFAEQVVDKMIEQGCVVKVGQDSGKKRSEPSQDTVTEVDDGAYQELVSQVEAAITLIKSKRVELFKAFNEVNKVIEDGSRESEGEKTGGGTKLNDKRGEQINTLINRISGNGSVFQKHIEQNEETKRRVQENVDKFETATNDFSKRGTELVTRANGIFGKLRKAGKERSEIESQIGNQKFKSKFKGLLDNGYDQKGKSPFKTSAKAGKFKSVKGLGTTKAGKNTMVNRLKMKFKNSAFAKTLRSIKSTVTKIVNVVKTVYSVIKKTIKAVYKVTKAAVKVTYKTVKFAAKTFYKASKLVGKGVKAGLNYAKSVITDIVKNGKNASIRYSSPAKVITRIGWRAIKFVGKKLWSGIKKLAMSGLKLLMKMFRVGARFVNKVSFYMLKLGAGVLGAGYKFLIEPISSMMVSVFGFMMDIVKQHVKFSETMVPNLLNKLKESVHNIKQGTARVLKSTWGVFKKILFNPITILLLVGGLFLFFGPKLLEWLTGMVGGIRDTLIPAIVSFAKKAIDILRPIWTCLKFIGGTLFKLVEWLTNPDNFIVKAITAIIKMVLMFKGFLKSMMKAAGKSSIDILCMFLAGDTIGIALHTAIGMIKSLWNYMQKKGIIKKIKNLFKEFPKVLVMIWAIPGTFLASIANASWAFLKWLGSKVGIGDDKAVSSVADAFAKPWKMWWSVIENIMNGSDENATVSTDEMLKVDPITQTEGTKNEARIAVRKLNMVGTNGARTLAKMDELSKVEGVQTDKGVLRRVKGMEKLYEQNTIQVMEFDKFLSGIAKMSEKNESNSEKLLSMLLEDPDLSQKILSVFFYYNPQNQEIQMLRPMQFIGQFVKNLQDLMDSNASDSWDTRLKLLVDALDQLNKERSHIINNQGTQITNFANKITNFDLNDKNAEKNLKMMVDEFNKGDLFKNIDVRSSFDQMSRGNAKTQNLKGKSGSALGSNNKILQANVGKIPAAKMDKEDFKLKKRDPNDFLVLNRVQVPPSMNPLPPPPPPDSLDEHGRDKNLVAKWRDQQEMRRKLLRRGVSSDEVEKMGYKAQTFAQFKKNFEETDPKERERLRKLREKQLAAYRVAGSVAKFNERGKVLTADETIRGMKFNPDGSPIIYNIPTDVKGVDILMFSPEWQQIMKAAPVSDAEAQLMVDETNASARREIVAQQRKEAQLKREEEDRKKREQSILDYSAKVSGGFIEVKIGEDVVAMQDAWRLHHRKRREALRKGMSSDQVDAMGLKVYSWEQWKRYYRKMHGLPEDGIKRIPFEGKKKERKIDWSTRSALSIDELAKYGIKVSEDGPVMIPLDKAMQAASELLKGAKTIHSIRDGLEVMRKGLESETQTLKKRREQGVPAAVVGGGSESISMLTKPVPPGGGSYEEAG